MKFRYVPAVLIDSIDLYKLQICFTLICTLVIILKDHKAFYELASWNTCHTWKQDTDLFFLDYLRHQNESTWVSSTVDCGFKSLKNLGGLRFICVYWQTQMAQQMPLADSWTSLFKNVRFELSYPYQLWYLRNSNRVNVNIIWYSTLCKIYGYMLALTE